MDWNLEVVTVPVSDLDRAKAFYADKADFFVDLDTRIGDGSRLVQLTPPGSARSIHLNTGIVDVEPGSCRGLHLVVSDAEAARAELVERGVDAGEVRHFDSEAGGCRGRTRSGAPSPRSFFRCPRRQRLGRARARRPRLTAKEVRDVA